MYWYVLIFLLREFVIYRVFWTMLVFVCGFIRNNCTHLLISLDYVFPMIINDQYYQIFIILELINSKIWYLVWQINAMFSRISFLKQLESIYGSISGSTRIPCIESIFFYPQIHFWCHNPHKIRPNLQNSTKKTHPPKILSFFFVDADLSTCVILSIYWY